MASELSSDVGLDATNHAQGLPYKAQNGSTHGVVLTRRLSTFLSDAFCFAAYALCACWSVTPCALGASRWYRVTPSLGNEGSSTHVPFKVLNADQFCTLGALAPFFEQTMRPTGNMTGEGSFSIQRPHGCREAFFTFLILLWLSG